MRGLALASIILAALPAACGGAGEDLDPGPADLQAGTAQTDGSGFIEVAEGADAELVSGAQGGFHVWVSYRVIGAFGPLELVRDARRTEDDAAVLVDAQVPIDVPEDAMTDWWESPTAVPSFMCPTPIGVGVVDHSVRIRIQLTTESGNLLGEDTVTVVPRCPSGEDEAWCYRICSG